MKFSNKQWVMVLLTILFLWIVGSAYYYTCNIRDFCKKENTYNQNYYNSNLDNNNNNCYNQVVKEEIVKDDNLDLQNVEKVIDIKETEKKIFVENTENIDNMEKKVIKCMTFLNSNIKLNSSKNIKSEVEKMEKFLNDYFNSNLEINGIYEYQDYDLVKDFQRENDLKIDGVVGGNTLRKMNAVNCVKNYYKEN